MSDIHILCVGKMKTKEIQTLEQDYAKRLKSLKLTIHELRAHGEDLDKEAKEIEKKLHDLKIERPILLTETGQSFSSPKFSQWLFELIETRGPQALVVGGAAGFHERLKNSNSNEFLSLGKMTYPHRLARLLLIEQLYRAECIKIGHPYHK